MSARRAGWKKLAVVALFTASCLGLLMFLWNAFGGAFPFQAKGYRVGVSFREGSQLASEADIRISGIPVGKVKSIKTNRRTGRSNAELEIKPRFAPLPQDTKAILRTKTLLGETYIELTPGDRKGSVIKDGGKLADANVAESVEFDELLRTFDPETRLALQEWLQRSATALSGRGADLSAAIGALSPFAQDSETLLRILDEQSGDVRRLVSGSGKAIGALSDRSGELSALVKDAKTLFAVTNKNGQSLQAALRALPTFEREAKTTIARVNKFSQDTTPLVKQLRPAARQLSPALADLEKLSPDLRALFRDLDPLISKSKTGLPALTSVTDALRPSLVEADELLRQTNPSLEFLGRYNAEFRGFLANSIAATSSQQVSPGGKPLNYLRSVIPLNLESIMLWRNRSPNSRPVIYPQPGAYTGKLPAEMNIFEDRQCARQTSGNAGSGAQLLDALAFLTKYSAPPCTPRQAQFVRSDGLQTDYPQIIADPPTPTAKK